LLKRSALLFGVDHRVECLLPGLLGASPPGGAAKTWIRPPSQHTVPDNSAAQFTVVHSSRLVRSNQVSSGGPTIRLGVPVRRENTSHPACHEIGRDESGATTD